jgi:hypothetical protein
MQSLAAAVASSRRDRPAQGAACDRVRRVRARQRAARACAPCAARDAAARAQAARRAAGRRCAARRVHDDAVARTAPRTWSSRSPITSSSSCRRCFRLRARSARSTSPSASASTSAAHAHAHVVRAVRSSSSASKHARERGEHISPPSPLPTHSRDALQMSHVAVVLLRTHTAHARMHAHARLYARTHTRTSTHA